MSDEKSLQGERCRLCGEVMEEVMEDVFRLFPKDETKVKENWRWTVCGLCITALCGVARCCICEREHFVWEMKNVGDLRYHFKEPPTFPAQVWVCKKCHKEAIRVRKMARKGGSS